MHPTKKWLFPPSSDDDTISPRRRSARSRTRLVVSAFAAFSMAGLIIPQAAVAATRTDVPSVRVVLPPETVRTALPPGVAVSRPAPAPAPKPKPKPKPAKPAHEVATKVLTTTPLPGATNIALSQRITIKLSAPPAKGAPMPALVPPVAGKWWVNGKTLTFVAAAGYGPWTTEHVVVKSPLAAPDQWTFTVGSVSVLRAQELLAELGYLPVNVDVSKGKPLLSDEPTRAALVPSAALPAVFTWRFPSSPLSMKSLWSADQYTVMTQGAVMNFEETEGLPSDGVFGPGVWAALTSAVASRHLDRAPYDYLVVSESLPESLTVWQTGKEIYQTPVNTGVDGANTPFGTWPVYARYVTTTMAGTDPDGFHYNVSGVPWVAYFMGGDAVHGYWRSYYGYPQSNGCVELPVSNAQVVWSMDPIGTLVTVS
jgi:peptidoglycan hydrolase-like protein with peptidoglycan-binding domain